MTSTQRISVFPLAAHLALAVASSACASLESAPATAAAPTLDARQVCELRAVAAAAISPDGTRAAVTRALPRKAGEDEDGPAWTELVLVDLATGSERPFIGGKGNISGVQWTHDGKSLSFVSKRADDKAAALYLIALDGGEARRALALPDAIGSYSLAKDGRRVALVAAEPEKPEAKKSRDKGFTQEIYEEDWRFSDVYVGELFSSEKPRMLGLEGHVHGVEWSPVDDRLLVAVTPTPAVDDDYMRQRLIVVDAQGKQLARVENPGKLGAWGWSPDGQRIALISAADIHDPSAGRLTIAPASGGAPVDLLPDYLGDVSSFAWQDATHLLCTASQGVWSVVEKVDVTGGAPKTLVGTGGPILGAISLSDDGQRATFVGSTPSHPPELFAMNHGDAGPRRLTDSNPWLGNVRLAEQQVVRFTARDGLELEGILNRPIDEQKGKRYPLILSVHGGPEAHHSNGWLASYSDPAQHGAARGFFVMHTNYRGSTGRGVAFSKLSQGDPAGREFDDLVDAVDWLVAQGWVDANKVAVTGGSYGGYATAWLSTAESKRFAAGVMFVGISDKVSKVGTTDIPDEEFYVHALKRPWDDWQHLLQQSPIAHAGDCRTPLLILHGKDDPRVNPGQSREMYRHLKLRSQAPVRLVLYPGEGHGNRKAAARLDYALRSMQWFEHYLLGPGGAPPPFELDYSAASPAAAGSAPASSSAAPRAAAG